MEFLLVSEPVYWNARGRKRRCKSATPQNLVDMAVTLPQYLVLTGGPIPQVGLHRKGDAPNRHLAREKVHGGKHFMATKKKAAKKKKKH
jgi:hypothetical protein